ncbi:hypothetical protein [Halobacillus faecis]
MRKNKASSLVVRGRFFILHKKIQVHEKEIGGKDKYKDAGLQAKTNNAAYLPT